MMNMVLVILDLLAFVRLFHENFSTTYVRKGNQLKVAKW